MCSININLEFVFGREGGGGKKKKRKGKERNEKEEKKKRRQKKNKKKLVFFFLLKFKFLHSFIHTLSKKKNIQRTLSILETKTKKFNMDLRAFSFAHPLFFHYLRR